MSVQTPYADSITSAQEFYTKTAEAWSQNVHRWLGGGGSLVAGLQPIDPAAVIDRYFDYVSRFNEQLVEVQRAYAKNVAVAMYSIQGAVREHTEGLTEVSRQQVDATTDLVREQADDIAQAATEQAEAAERDTRREAQQARRARRNEISERYRDLTKAELHDELARRDLLRSGTVDEMRQRLIQADLQAENN